MKSTSVRTLRRNNVFRRKALALAIGSAAMGLTGIAFGQATAGTIYGTAPAAPGETIQVTSGAVARRAAAACILPAANCPGSATRASSVHCSNA